MIKENIKKFIARGRVPVYKDVISEDVGYRRVKKTRKYLICDCCGTKIWLDIPKPKRFGGILELSYILTKEKTTQIAICDNCAKTVFDEFWNE